MKTEKHDRRSERTRRMLEEALVSLMLERRYADLTVQDILDRANIGRSTFYAHFWDKDDLLAASMAHMIETLNRQVDQSAGDAAALLPSLGLFRHVADQYNLLYKAFMPSQGMEIVSRHLRAHLGELIEQRLRALASAPLPDVTVTVAAQAVIGTFLALLQWWLEEEMPLPPEQMDAYFRQLALPGVQSLLKPQA
ncbi:MAG TPA: TetR/AcrR family transcriptional regulator [Ktedonobacterales bacterium]|nr:TetR/AcrR family transcriptional regulator [Ktedonobacterales bacterium]